MAHVAASLSAGPVLHHRFADTSGLCENKKEGEGRDESEQRRKYERGKRKRTVSESLRSSRETNLLASLPADGAHILISTRSPSYYWLKINRPFRG